MGEVDHLLLQPIVEAHVGLDQVVTELGGLLQFLRQLPGPGERHPARIVNTGSIERPAGREHARTAADAGADRFFLFERFKAVRRGVAHGGDAVGEPDAAELFAVLGRQMRMHLDQARHDHVVRRIDHASAVQVGPVIDDLFDAIVANDDIDIAAQRGGFAVEHASRVHHDAALRNLRLPRQIDRHIGDAGVHLRQGSGGQVGNVDQLQAAWSLIQQPLRVRGPRRRVGQIVREPPRRTGHFARRRRRHDVHDAVHHERHLRSIARPHRPIARARAD